MTLKICFYSSINDCQIIHKIKTKLKSHRNHIHHHFKKLIVYKDQRLRQKNLVIIVKIKEHKARKTINEDVKLNKSRDVKCYDQYVCYGMYYRDA